MRGTTRGEAHGRGLRYMPALDGLRALAVIAVLLYHGDVSWARGGYFGVDAFFVLSGFLITSLLLDEWARDRRIDLKAFWARRARRLLPALAVVLAAVVVYAGAIASPLELARLRSDALSTLGYVANWNQIFSHESYFEQLATPSPLRHTWSLAIEEQFYLVWPLLVLALLRFGRGSRRQLFGFCAILAAGSAALMALLHESATDPSRVYYGTDTRAQSLLIGAMLATLLARNSGIASLSKRSALHVGAVLAAMGLAWIWTTTSEADGWQYRGGYALAAVLVAVVIAAVTQPHGSGLLGVALSTRPLRAIGVISYGLYLWHWPVYVFVTTARTGYDGAALLGARLVLTFALATASFFVVEHPIRQGALRGWNVRVVGPATAAALIVGLVLTTATTVRPAFEDFSASELRPPPVVDGDVAASSPAPPQRVMLVGDSVARSMGPGIERSAHANGFAFWDASVPGCGLATDIGERWFAHWQGLDPRCTPGWRERWPAQLAEFNPDVVVALFGAQDAFDRQIDGRVVNFDTSEGIALAQQDLEAAVDTLSSTGAHVILLTAPYYRICCPMQIEVERSPMNEAWINLYNDAQREVARRSAAGVMVLDLNRVLAPAGTWTDTVDGVKVRSFDRSHFSEEGADFVARWLVPQLLHLRNQAPATATQSLQAAVALSLVALG